MKSISALEKKNSLKWQIKQIQPTLTVTLNNLLLQSITRLHIFIGHILESQQHWADKANRGIHKQHTSKKPETTLTLFYFSVDSYDVKSPS